LEFVKLFCDILKSNFPYEKGFYLIKQKTADFSQQMSNRCQNGIFQKNKENVKTA